MRLAGGEVLEDVKDIAKVYEQADVLVAPHTIGGGTKFKMLEAMASGLPIVTTTEGMSGLEAKPGIHYFHAQTPGEFVAQMAAVRDNTKRTQAVTAKARAFVTQRYDWEHIAKMLEDVWNDAYAKK